MGREVRRVPADWQHPKDDRTGEYRPLPSGEFYEDDVREFLRITNTEGLQAAIEYFGKAPERKDYMPNWPASERTHYMMYEDCTEGTPISPAFPSPEALAHWLTDTGASAFADLDADYEHWLRVAHGRSAPSMVLEDGKIYSGVQGI